MPQSRPTLHARILSVATVDSTNAEAQRCARAGEAAPFWVVAEAQTAGRGRSGRGWTSAAGNLYASLFIRLPATTPNAYQLSLVAGVAAIDAIRAAGCLAPDARLRLKWPNDILIDGEKAGGVLVESSLGQAGLEAVVGVGINIASHPDGLDQPATHLGAHGPAPDARSLLEHLAAAMDEWLAVWAAGAGFAPVREAWLARSGSVGEPLSVNTGGEAVAGSFGGLDADGALILRDALGGERRFSFGDVTLVAAG